MDSATLAQSIIDAKALLVDIQIALKAIVTGNVQSYTLDSSQSRQTVMKLNITELRRLKDSTENEICVLEARQNSVPDIGRGGW